MVEQDNLGLAVILNDKVGIAEAIARGVETGYLLYGLCTAVSSGKLDYVRLFLDARPPLDEFAQVPGEGGVTGPPLIEAIESNHIEIAKLLLAEGASPKVHDRTLKPAILCAANRRDSLEFVRLLLEAGADPNQADRDGMTALMVASKLGNLPVVSCLIAAGADFHAKTKGGFFSGPKSALRFAMDKGHTQVVRALVDAGCEE